MIDELETKSADVPGLISGFVFDDDRALAGPSLTAAQVLARNPAGGYQWLHFSLSNQQCHDWIGRHLSIPEAVLGTFLSSDDHQRIVRHGDYVCGVVADLSQSFGGETDDSVRLYFILTEGLLVTGRHRPVQSVHRLRAALSDGVMTDGPGGLLAELLLSFVDRVESIADRLADELESVEDRVLDNHPLDETGRLAPLRQLAARQHRLIRNYRRALKRFGQTRDSAVASAPLALGGLADRLEQADVEFDDIASRARLLHDEMVAKLAGQTNRTLFVLSTITAVFLPPTLVVGFFGMNFSSMPFIGDSGGVWIGLAACLLSSAAVWIVLKRISRP